MPGQTSMDVDKSASKVNGQLTEHLDPQQVGSLVQNPNKDRGIRGKLLA